MQGPLKTSRNVPPNGVVASESLEKLEKSNCYMQSCATNRENKEKRRQWKDNKFICGCMSVCVYM